MTKDVNAATKVTCMISLVYRTAPLTVERCCMGLHACSAQHLCSTWAQFWKSVYVHGTVTSLQRTRSRKLVAVLQQLLQRYSGLFLS